MTTEGDYTYVGYGATGEGTYGTHYSDFTETLLEPLESFILDLVKGVPFPDKSQVYNIGDYGAADGAASMTFMRKLLVCLKAQHGPEVDFQVIYEDLEVNDFNSLFKRLSGHISNPPSYLQDLDKVFALASGTNFYKMCVPSNSMHVIFCLTAAHWLSRRPTVYRKSICGFFEASEDEKKLLRIQASTDWENFLLLRSRELKSGGLLFAWVSSKLYNKLKKDKLSCEILYKTLNTLWKRFRDSGKITEEEFIQTNFACNLFTLDQLKAPFCKPASLGSKAGLEILKAETFSYSMSAYNIWRRNKDEKGIDNRENFARNYVCGHRCWSNNTFMSGLADKRTVMEKEALVDEFYQEVEAEIRGFDPEVFRDEVIMSSIIIRKL